MNLLNSKKGYINESMAVVGAIFVLFLGTIIGYAVYDGFTGEIQNMSMVELNNSDVKATIEGFDRGMNMWDKILAFLVFSAILSVGWFAYNFTPPRIFLVLIWIWGFFIGFVSLVFSYTFGVFASQPALASTMTHFPMTNILGSNLHWIGLACIVIGTVLAFRNSSGGSQGGGL